MVNSAGAPAIGLACSSTSRAVTNIVVVPSINEAKDKPNNLTEHRLLTGRTGDAAEPSDEIHCGERMITSSGERVLVIA